MLLKSFSPIVGKHAKTLILGSMPGAASLAAQQYYAHPRNAFWPIMTQWLKIPFDVPYQYKVAALTNSPIALWDVLHTCHRIGSLDSNIETETQIVNDFRSFFSNHPTIKHVFFNGGKAYTSFKRSVQSRHEERQHLLLLPSTSPANARMTFEEKTRIWHEKIDSVLSNGTIKSETLLVSKAQQD